MNALNNAKLAAKKAAGINIHLYSDDHPETTVSGTGFKDSETAHRTIELVKQKPRNRQVWTINAMYYRAKHHPSQTASMRDAMGIFQLWLDEYNKEKRDKPKKNSAIKNEKKEKGKNREKVEMKKRRRSKSTSSSHDGDNDDHATNGNKKLKPINLSRSRAELEMDYKELFNVTLPNIAKYENWPIRLNHCFMRVALDTYWQCCWYDKLDQKKGALKSMTVPQIENVIVVGQKMTTKGKSYVIDLNRQSLFYRGKQGPGGDKSILKNQTQGQILDSTAGTSTIKRESGENSRDPDNANKNYNKEALLQVERAVSGRASCRGCKEKISKGDYRVGIQAWSSGRNVVVWHHPVCFVRDAVRIEKLDRGSSARCKYTGDRFVKGDLRIVLQVGSTKNYYHALVAVKPLLAPVYDVITLIEKESLLGIKHAEVGLSLSDTNIAYKKIQGFDQLNDDDGSSILAALSVATCSKYFKGEKKHSFEFL